MKEYPQNAPIIKSPEQTINESTETNESKEKMRRVSLNGVDANIYKSQHVYHDDKGWHYDPCTTINIYGAPFGYGGHVYTGKEKKVLEMRAGLIDSIRAQLGIPRKKEFEFNQFIRKIPAEGDIQNIFKDLYIGLEKLVTDGTFYDPITGNEGVIANNFSWNTKKQITITELVSLLTTAGVRVEDLPARPEATPNTVKEIL